MQKARLDRLAERIARGESRLGMVTGADGKSFSLDKVKSNLKEKACDFVLDNAKSLI